MEKVIKAYDPANAAKLSDADKAALGNLTTEEIYALAKAYPNAKGGKAGRGYLVLKDKSLPENRQLYPVSSWENLAELHKQGLTQYVPAGFKATFSKTASSSIPVGETQDLTKEELEAQKPKARTKAKVEEAEEETDDVNDNLPDLGNETSNTRNQGQRAAEVNKGQQAAAKKAASKGAPRKAAAKKGAAKKSGQ